MKYSELVVIPKSVLDNLTQNKEYQAKISAQAKPLQPLIENAFDTGRDYGAVRCNPNLAIERKQKFMDKGVESYGKTKKN